MRVKFIEQIEECHGFHNVGGYEIKWEDGDRYIIMNSRAFKQWEYDEFEEDQTEELNEMTDQHFFLYVENKYDFDDLDIIFNKEITF